MQRSASFSLSHFVGTHKLAWLMEPSDLQVAEEYFGRMNALNFSDWDGVYLLLKSISITILVCGQKEVKYHPAKCG